MKVEVPTRNGQLLHLARRATRTILDFNQICRVMKRRQPLHERHAVSRGWGVHARSSP